MPAELSSLRGIAGSSPVANAESVAVTAVSGRFSYTCTSRTVAVATTVRHGSGALVVTVDGDDSSLGPSAADLLPLHAVSGSSSANTRVSRAKGRRGTGDERSHLLRRTRRTRPGVGDGGRTIRTSDLTRGDHHDRWSRS